MERGQAARGHEQLHVLLVHAGRAGEHPGPRVPGPRHLQQALDRAVLAERAVQHREDDVEAVTARLQSEEIPYEIGISRYRELARGQILGDSHGMLKLLVSATDHTLHGVHALRRLTFGPRPGEAIVEPGHDPQRHRLSDAERVSHRQGELTDALPGQIVRGVSLSLR